MLYAQCPGEGKILPFFRGRFDTVYILLHPFINPTQMDSEAFEGEDWPNKHEIISGCDPISWRQVLGITQLNTLADIDVGLRTSNFGIYKEG